MTALEREMADLIESYSILAAEATAEAIAEAFVLDDRSTFDRKTIVDLVLAFKATLPGLVRALIIEASKPAISTTSTVQ